MALANPEPGSKFFIGANFWRIDWEGPGDFFASSVNWATTTNPWLPAFLNDLEPYTVLRFMDWNLANDDPNPQAVWSTRKQKTESQAGEPVAFEWQIDLCNRTKSDCWLTIPIQADTDYQQKLATLVNQLLDPSLRVYVEYSNELWNGQFPQYAILLQKATSLGMTGDEDVRASKAYVYGAVRLFEQFESVFGKNGSRLVKVLSGQSSWSSVCDYHMASLKDAKVNPNGTRPTVFAIAPYFSGNSIAELGASIPNTIQGAANNATCAKAAGIPLVSYEGGSDSFAAGDGCMVLQKDAAMYGLYQTFLDGLANAGLTGPFMHYTHVGECWGLKQKTTDSPAESPKYRAVVDWVANH